MDRTDRPTPAGDPAPPAGDLAPPAGDLAPKAAREPAPPGLGDLVDTPILDLRATGARIETVSLLFDPNWYLWKYRDVEAAGVDPVQHYFVDGHKEGRNPNRYFDTDWYTANNPDVLATGSNPFLHYVLYGAREGRKPRR